jgi:hypothetical protein
MNVTKKSALTGVIRTIDLPITEEQYRNYIDGMLVQDAFPDLSPDDREFIISGVTTEEWDALYANS